MKKELRILVAGEANTGKTCAIRAIHHLLAERGIDVQVRQLADEPYDLLTPEEALKALADRDIKVVLEERMLSRRDYGEPVPTSFRDPLTGETKSWAKLPNGAAIWRDTEGNMQVYILGVDEALTSEGLIAPGMIHPEEAQANRDKLAALNNGREPYKPAEDGETHSGAAVGETGPEHHLPLDMRPRGDQE